MTVQEHAANLYVILISINSNSEAKSFPSDILHFFILQF